MTASPPVSSVPARSRYVLLALAFLLSGTCALAYQVVWARMLSLLFGSTNQAIATVLAVFMLGLALGSHFGEKVSRRGRDLGRAYGLMEMTLGLFALCFPFLIARMGTVHALAFSLLHQNETLLSMARFGIAFALLIIPTALMGATLPVLAQHVEHDRTRVGSKIGALYAINTFGAALGAFASAFIAIPFHGLHWTIYGAAFVNVLVGLACFVLLQDAPVAPEQPAPARTRSAKRPAHTPIEKAIPLWLVFCVLFTIGTVGMVLENAWSHALVLVFGTSVYAFATMLTSYLIGLSAGCFVASRFLLRFGAKGCLGALLLINGLAIFCTTPMIGYLPKFFVTVFGDMQAQWHVVMAKEFLACAALMFLPTFLGGATFPVCLNIIATSGSAATASSARATSLAYIWNTAGSIFGALVAGFALVPLFGSERSLLVAASLSILASVAVLLHREATTTWRAGFAVAALAFSIASPALLTTWDASIMNSGVYVYSKYFTTEQSLQREMRNYDILFYREGSASVAVLESQAGHRFLRVNGKTDGSSEGDNTTQMLLGYLPFLYAKDHANALVIGLGTGVTSACALDLPMTSVESIEISPEVVEAAGYFTALNESVFSDPRSTIRVLDGRTWLASMPNTYDLIVSEPSNPWQTGNANLFTADFFRIAASRLNEGGVLCQWIPYYNMDGSHFRLILKSLQQTFPHVHLWMSGTDTFLLSSKQPLEIKPERLRTLFDTEQIKNKFNEVGIESATALLSFHYLDSTALESMTRGIDMLNTDAFPIVEFHSPKYLLGPNRPDIFFDILEASYASPLNATRLGVDDTARILHRREFYSRWRIPSRVTDEMIRRALSE